MTKLTAGTAQLTASSTPPAGGEMGGRWVTMGNALARASHGLSLAEKRIVALAVSKLDSARPLRPGEAPVTRIYADEYAEMYDIDINTAYEQLRAAGAALYQRSVTFFEPAFRRDGKPLEPTRVTMRWVGRAKYQAGEAWIELAWWHELLKHLTGLQRQFTSYQLKQASALRSAHSWKLLELLSRFKSSGIAEYTIEDFCESMEATEKQRKDFAAIRVKIIEPSVKELKEKDGWEIEWSPIKAGRKVKALRFTFRRDPQQSLF